MVAARVFLRPGQPLRPSTGGEAGEDILLNVSFVMKNCLSHVRFAALPLALAAAFPSFAQTQLKETVVTATRVAQPLADLVADVSILDRASIERSAATGLADLLARVPGVEMARNGGPGTTTSVFVRGGETRFTAVYIDGVRVDSQSTGGANWQSIPLSQIDRVEVLRGPAGAVYGSDAISGVIQIFTRKGESAFAPTVSVGLGSQQTSKLDVGFSGANAGFDYALSVARETSDGFNSRTVATQNPDNDGYRLDAASARLGFQINPAHRIEASMLSTDLDAQYDSGLTGDARTLSKLQTVGLNWQAKWSDVYSTKLSVSQALDQYETKPSPYLSTTTLRGYLLQNEFRLDGRLITVALERKEDQLENVPINRSRAQDALALGYGFSQQQHAVQMNWRHDNDSEFGGQNTGSLAYGYALTPQWRATASAATAFRAPTLYQRFSIYGVASLQPETSRNIEAGLRYAQGSSSLGLVAYRNRVTNLITYAAGAGTCQNGSPAEAYPGCFSNTASAEYSGVTLSGSHRLGGVAVSASLDLQDPKDLVTGKQLARRARQHASVGAVTEVGRWHLDAQAQLSGERPDSLSNNVQLAGYVLLNLSASTPVSRDWTLLARMDNLLDQSYMLANTYATAGRSVYLGLTWAPK